jgi:hypothetical protein
MTLITAPSPTNADPDAIDALPGQAPVQQPATGPRPGGRDGPLRNGNPRGRFAATAPPGLRGRQSELARPHAEAAALAPWKAALVRARMIKRLMKSPDRSARCAELGQNAMQPRPPGACPGGGTVRPGGAADEGSDANSMDSGAGGGRAGAPAAAVASKAGAACEGSDMNSLNSGAGGVTAGAGAEAPAADVASRDGAAREGSDRISMNSGAGGGTAGGVPRHLPRPLPPGTGWPAKVPTWTP